MKLFVYVALATTLFVSAVNAGCLRPEHFQYHDVIPEKWQGWYDKATGGAEHHSSCGQRK